SPTSSAAYRRGRVGSPAAPRTAGCTLRPVVPPRSSNPCTNGARRAPGNPPSPPPLIITPTPRPPPVRCPPAAARPPPPPRPPPASDVALSANQSRCPCRQSSAYSAYHGAIDTALEQT